MESFAEARFSLSALTTSTASVSNSIFSTPARYALPFSTMPSTWLRRSSQKSALLPNFRLSSLMKGTSSFSASTANSLIWALAFSTWPRAAFTCTSAASKVSATFSTKLRSSTSKGLAVVSTSPTSGSSSPRKSVTLLMSANRAVFFSAMNFARSSAFFLRTREASSSRAMPTATRRRWNLLLGTPACPSASFARIFGATASVRPKPNSPLAYIVSSFLFSSPSLSLSYLSNVAERFS
mmetsp:Transcript_90299/g.269404  ORF Transcript_90299/g.269404 Transcript_90299/m.269404 type:complete len:238 (+) Transcript_90299:705-1418(+)